MKNNPIDVQFMRERFYYEPELGHLFYRHNVGTKMKKGDRAGSIDKDGYRTIKFNHNKYFEHRIIYAIVTGRDPKDKHIHHVNGVKDHNNFYNLQALTHAEHRAEHKDNSFLEIHPLERPINKLNTSGINGVYWEEQQKRWRVKVTIGGRCRCLGSHKDLESAKTRICEAWDEYQATLNA